MKMRRLIRMSLVRNRNCILITLLCICIYSRNISVSETVQQDTKPVSTLMGVIKDDVVVKARPGVGRGRGRPVNSQSTEV